MTNPVHRADKTFRVRGRACRYLCTVNSKLFPALTITSCASLCLRLYTSVLLTLITASPALKPAASAGDPVLTCNEKCLLEQTNAEDVVRRFETFRRMRAILKMGRSNTIDTMPIFTGRTRVVSLLQSQKTSARTLRTFEKNQKINQGEVLLKSYPRVPIRLGVKACNLLIVGRGSSFTRFRRNDEAWFREVGEVRSRHRRLIVVIHAPRRFISPRL